MKILNRIFVFVLGVTLLTACYDEPGLEIVWDGESYLEIDEAGVPNANVNFVVNKLAGGNSPAVGYELTAQIQGRAQTGPVNANFEFGGTAIEGVHYNLPSGSNVSIPAGEFSAILPIELLPDAYNVGETIVLEIGLSGGDLPLSQYTEITLNISPACPFEVGTFLGAYSCVEPGYGGSPYDVNFTAGTNANDVVIDNFWDFGGVATYTFNANGTVTLAQQTISMGGEDWVVEGSGTYETCSGQFVVDYTVVRVSDGGTYDDNTHTFNKK